MSKTVSPAVSGRPRPSVKLAVVAVFAALIAVFTSVLSIPVPPPLFEITLAPAIYLALSALVDPWTSGSAIGIGSFIGEAFNIATKPGGSPIYPFGIVWARVPEAFIISWAKGKGRGTLITAMVASTMFETIAFFLPDWAFYYYGLFSYNGGAPTDVVTAFTYASADIVTVVDLAFIPVALAIIGVARPAFRRLGFN
ncbi:MAG: hypothetical protein HY296_03455 [Thaumarchaeota archaeon]|nr:hypothetical protein [Nitrososphaerota archaeon]